MQLPDFLTLFDRQGQWALESAAAFEPREKDFLGDFKMLAKRFGRELARAALTTAILRIEAEKKFPHAKKMYFTREAMEQATPWEVSSYRAERFAGMPHILDLACSVGGDTIALAQHAPTIGIDNDLLRIHMAKANAQALNANAQFIQADLNALPLKLNSDTTVFFDPARRTDGQRAFSVKDYTPPLDIIETWLPHTPNLAVKVSPGVNLEELANYDCEIEFISLNGELKEAVLWFGDFKRATKRATLLPGPHTLTAEDIPTLPITEPQAYIYEPDPAILRAGLVTVVGVQINAAQLDPQIAYLTSDTLTETPYARAWQVEDWLPFNLKKLRAHLREHNIGRVTVKKRGSPLTPEELIQDLKLEGEEEKILFLTQINGKHSVIITNNI